MKEQIKQLRVNIDGLAQLTKNLNPITTPIYGEPCDCICHNTYGDISHMAACCNNGIKFGTEQEGPSFNSNEISKAYDSLILAKAWLGKLLGELGEATPYANDGNRKEVKDIEPAVDKAEVVPGLREPFTGKDNTEEVKKCIDTWELNGKSMNFYSDFNHIEKVDWLREEVGKIVEEVKNFPTFGGATGIDVKQPREASISRTNVYNHLSEARFWLGFELQRIKENKI